MENGIEIGVHLVQVRHRKSSGEDVAVRRADLYNWNRHMLAALLVCVYLEFNITHHANGSNGNGQKHMCKHRLTQWRIRISAALSLGMPIVLGSQKRE